MSAINSKAILMNWKKRQGKDRRDEELNLGKFKHLVKIPNTNIARVQGEAF